MTTSLQTAAWSALDQICQTYDPAFAPEAERREIRRDNRHYAVKILKLAGNIRHKKILFLGMGQEEAACLLARGDAAVVYGTWSEKTLFYARKTVLADYADVLDRVTFQLVDPRSLRGVKGDYDCVVVMKAAKQMLPGDFAGLLSELLVMSQKAPTVIVHTSPNAALTGPAFYFAGIACGKRRWKSRTYGLNEYHYYSWKRMLEKLGRTWAIVPDKQPRFFSRQVIHQEGMSLSIVQAALLLDWILDSTPLSTLSRSRFFAPLLATDLWAVIGAQQS